MRPICILNLMILVLGSALGDYHLLVKVDENSTQNQGNFIIKKDACIRDLRFRIKKPTDSFTIEVIEDGTTIEEFHNDSDKLEVGQYNLPLDTTHVKKGTTIRLTVVGRESSVKLTFKVKETCLSDIPTIIATTSYVSPTTIGRVHQSEPQKDLKNWSVLLLLIAFILAITVSIKYRQKILKMYRDMGGNHDVKQVATVIHETSAMPTGTQCITVNPQRSVKCHSSLLKSSSSTGNINDDYAELRTSDSNYAVPDIRVSHVSLSSFPSLEDDIDDCIYHQPRHYSMSALSSQNYSQPRTNNNISTRSMHTLPIYPIDAQDYMSMGGSFPSINHYDRPSSHSLSENTVKKQFVKDQEDYVSMFTQEENYSNIGRKPGESFRDKKYVRKYKHKTNDK